MTDNSPDPTERVTMHLIRDGNGDFGQRGQQPVATTPMPVVAQSVAPAAPPAAPSSLTGVVTAPPANE